MAAQLAAVFKIIDEFGKGCLIVKEAEQMERWFHMFMSFHSLVLIMMHLHRRHRELSDIAIEETTISQMNIRNNISHIKYNTDILNAIITQIW